MIKRIFKIAVYTFIVVFVAPVVSLFGKDQKVKSSTDGISNIIYPENAFADVPGDGAPGNDGTPGGGDCDGPGPDPDPDPC